MTAAPDLPAPVRRSRFVSGLAWFTIVSSALGLAGSVCSGAVLLATGGDLAGSVGASGAHLPSGTETLLQHLPLLFFLGAAGSALTLATGIGLKRRREWARLAFIWVLAGSSLYGFVNLFLQRAAFGHAAASAPTGAAGDQLRAQMDAMGPGLAIMALMGALLFAVVNAVIIARLCSAKVRAEFDTDD